MNMDHMKSCRSKISEHVQNHETVMNIYDKFSDDLMNAPFSNESKERILNAAVWASDAHKKQKRKDKMATPYIVHPLDVANRLIDPGKCCDENIVIGALLHDTVEDTEVTIEDVDREFGSVVSGYVSEVTDDKSLAKEERKRLQVEHAPHKSTGAAQIKLADKSSNTSDLLASPPPDWSPERVNAYFEWAKQVVDALPDANPNLKAVFMDQYSAFTKK